MEEVGDFHFGSDGFAAAMEYYEQALASLSPGGDARFEARLYRKLADCHRCKGTLDEALAVLERARALLRGFELEVEHGVVLARRAEIYCQQGKLDVALQNSQLAIDILRPTSAHRDYGFALMVAATCHGRVGDRARFEQLNQDALATFRRIDDQEGIADVCNDLGIGYKNACQWDKALRAFGEAKAIGERLGLTRRLARTLGNLGIVYTKTRDFHEAIAHLRRARRLAQNLGDHASLVSIQNSLGRVLTMVGRYSQAERCLLEARVLAEKQQLGRSLALADEFLGDLMRAQGRLEEARRNYDTGLRRARGIAPQGDVVGEVLRRIAELELQSGLRSQAIATARRALRVCEACGERHEVGFIHRTLGLALQGLGKRDEAERSLEASVQAFVATHNAFEAAESRAYLAALYLEGAGREAHLRAVRHAESALETFRALEEEGGYARSGLLLARAHRALGNHDEGLLVLYDVERVCGDSPEVDLLPQVRALRHEFERALVHGGRSETSPLHLFSELLALAGAGADPETHLEHALTSVCARTASQAAFLALAFPGLPEPIVRGRRGIEVATALQVARHLTAEGAEARVLAQVDGAFAESFPERAAAASTIMWQPLEHEGRTLGCVYLERARGQAPYGREDVDLVAAWAGLAAVVLHDVFHEEFREAESASRTDLDPVLRRVLTVDPAMMQILALAQKVARSSCTVLLSGETGTGKGLLAHCIHLLSERRARKFMALNCAALPEPLLESELFGHVRGAFTGADADKIGLLEAANGGTVFLDEVGKTSLFMQGKLLQFLDSSEVRPVGANVFRKVDVRVICASKGSLRDLAAAGDLLEDLYYRLNDFPITIPPLRERRGDVKLLVEHYLRRFADEMRKRIPGVTRHAMQVMQDYAWPGNVRELEKSIKRAAVLVDDGEPLGVRHLPDELKSPQARAAEVLPVQEGLTLREQVARVEAVVIRDCLRRTRGNKSEAARLLGISYPSLLQKIKLYGADAG